MMPTDVGDAGVCRLSDAAAMEGGETRVHSTRHPMASRPSAFSGAGADRWRLNYTWRACGPGLKSFELPGFSSPAGFSGLCVLFVRCDVSAFIGFVLDPEPCSNRVLID